MFQTQEASRTLGEPVDLYLFTYGPGASDYYGYTDAETAITLGTGLSARTYTPTAISRDAIKSSGTLDKSALTVSTAGGNVIAELFRVYPPVQVVTLVIYQGHIGDPDSEFLVIWSGRVLSCKRLHSEAELTCEPIATSMKRSGLRRHYQYGCPHALYQGDASGGCRALKAPATRATTVSAISGARITLPTGWNGAFDKTKFRGGLAEWSGAGGAAEKRTILQVNVATNEITLSGGVRNLAVAGALNVILGCNHQMDDCQVLHNVINDFGGQPWIPTKNPIGNYNNYY